MLSHYWAQWHIGTFLFKWTMVSMALLQNSRGPRCNPSELSDLQSFQRLPTECLSRWIPPATLYLQDNIIQSVSLACFKVSTCCSALSGSGHYSQGSLPGHPIEDWRSSSECVYSASTIQRGPPHTVPLFKWWDVWREITCPAVLQTTELLKRFPMWQDQESSCNLSSTLWQTWCFYTSYSCTRVWCH